MKYLTFLPVLCCLAQAPPPTAMPATSPVTSLELRNVEFDHRDRLLRFELVNRGSKAVHGYTYGQWFQWPGSHDWIKGGEGTHHSAPPPRSIQPADAPPGTGPIAPGEVRAIINPYGTASRNGVEPTSRKLVLLAAFFEDGTAEGDPRIIADFQMRTSSRAAEAARWLPKLIAARDSSDLRAALHALHDVILDVSYAEDKAKFGAPSAHPDESRFVREMLLRNFRQFAEMPGPVHPDTLNITIEQLKREAGAAQSPP